MARPPGYKLSRATWDDLIVNALHLTVTDVSHRTGIQTATISNLIGQKTGASLPMARKLCEPLGVQIATLFPATDPIIVSDARIERTAQAA